MDLEQRLLALGPVRRPLQGVINWGRTNSMWPMFFSTACCPMELFATLMPHVDIARFGMKHFWTSPRQSDLLIVAGRVSRKMAPVVRRLYDQMLEPRWGIAMGDCASCGGGVTNYAIVQGVDEIVPVDVYVAGCPPRPEALLHGILTLHTKINQGSSANPVSAERQIATGS